MLQSFSKTDFPLQKYIIDVENDILPPPYLNEQSKYTLHKHLPSDFDEKLENVQILNISDWPHRNYFILDESQFDAFRAALTKQLTIIQGPPGALNE